MRIILDANIWKTVDAIYIGSGDADLTVLRQHGETQIISLSELKNRIM